MCMYMHISNMQTQIDLGEVWLKLMGGAAQRYGLTIQYVL